MSNPNQPTSKTTQVRVVAETVPLPSSQKVETMALFDSAGKPLRTTSSAASTPVVAPALVPSGTAVPVDASQGKVFDLTLTSSTLTVSAPTNAVDGQEIVFRIKQGGSGSYTLAWNAIYDFGTTPGAVTLSTSVGKVDDIMFRYNASLTKWCAITVAKGE